MGGPGAGKGTQCERLAAKYPELTYFSIGDIIVRKSSQVNEDGEKFR